ncbi:FeoB-associated Cys-rich membrane protein [Paenibacillus apiarius]|uniref:FeoB-associated Cys-rich membrane protein n=1 Tax=Paenibacillus apiarius TaxID=46240 RepID=UPI00197DF464|nr:FeoB-associated Cys-rich membrane protein [Paenibacillus apiarius]MBN3523121.1 FeoB-associated Cys-rich membrane protein [Paenibacillus apiarius]
MPWIEIGFVAIIFAYAIWMVVRHVRKSKQGACASCALNRSCTSACSAAEPQADRNSLDSRNLPQ